MLMLNRAFFSLQSSWIPTSVALGNLGLNAALDAVLYRLGVWGIPLATSIVNMAGTAALLILLHRRLGRLDLATTVDSVVRVAIASAALAGAAYGVWRLLDGELGRSTGAQILSLGTAILAGLDAYLFFCILLRVRELEAVLSLRARVRLPRR
jgi:peptidoglycan biosynthesis protein MviN/MurJ (putative lipid II flippase)